MRSLSFLQQMVETKLSGDFLVKLRSTSLTPSALTAPRHALSSDITELARDEFVLVG